jgi:starch synthase
MPRSINILFLAAEAEPFIKIGGLADVAGTLPLVLRGLPDETGKKAALDVRLVLPLHGSFRSESMSMIPLGEVAVPRGRGTKTAHVYSLIREGMPVYFIDGDLLSDASKVYSTDPALDREKYTFFSLATLEMLHHLNWQPDIIHANDWHTALALFAARSRQSDPVLRHVHTLLTLHNLPYMGGDGKDTLSAYNLKISTDESLPSWARTQPLPLGLISSDAIIPVSPTYAQEILTPEFGCGLDSFLLSRKERITGILNGLDLASFDPEVDKALCANFNQDSLEKREENKQELQKLLGLQIDPFPPLFGMVGRLDHQKGVDIALNVINNLGDQPWQFVILGTGDPNLENMAHSMQATFPERFRAVLRYDAPMGRMIYGGADIFLMPSRYEPCGLAQMIAMRYGCVPVVRGTGGLKDTVREGQTGFLFQEASPDAMMAAIKRALSAFTIKERWQRYQRNCMLEDFSWQRSARQYATIYRSLVGSKT